MMLLLLKTDFFIIVTQPLAFSFKSVITVAKEFGYAENSQPLKKTVFTSNDTVVRTHTFELRDSFQHIEL